MVGLWFLVPAIGVRVPDRQLKSNSPGDCCVGNRRPCFGDPHEILKGYKIMEHLRVILPEEVEQREEAKKAKDEARRLHREKIKNARAGRRKRK